MKIKLLWKYLCHDIEQLTHRYAQLRLADNPELSDMAEFGNNASDKQLELRYVLTGVGNLRKVLRDYIANRTTDADDKLTNPNEWLFEFKEELFDSYALAELMHWFIVRWAVLQWTQVFSPNDASIAKTDFDDTKNDLANLLLDSSMPTKERRTASGMEDEEETIIVFEPTE